MALFIAIFLIRSIDASFHGFFLSMLLILYHHVFFFVIDKSNFPRDICCAHAVKVQFLADYKLNSIEGSQNFLLNCSTVSLLTTMSSFFNNSSISVGVAK